MESSLPLKEQARQGKTSARFLPVGELQNFWNGGSIAGVVCFYRLRAIPTNVGKNRRQLQAITSCRACQATKCIICENLSFLPPPTTNIHKTPYKPLLPLFRYPYLPQQQKPRIRQDKHLYGAILFDYPTADYTLCVIWPLKS